MTADLYRDLFAEGGRTVSLERVVPNAAALRLDGVLARIRGATSEELAGGVLATERVVMLLAADVPDGWRPLKKNDAILVDGLRLAFKERPDDQTHRDGESLLAYVGRVSGA